jgi:signal transduction histidine kinase
VITLSGGTLPGLVEIEELRARMSVSLDRLADRIPLERLVRIKSNIGGFSADPRRIDVFFNTGDATVPGEGPLSLRGNGVGTHFLIQPADDFLGDEIDRDLDSDADPAFTKFLVGFANTMVPGAPPPRVLARFRDWKTVETASELIAGGAFLTPEDFQNADHHFSGRFDEFGQFEGEVKIYDEPAVSHVIAWEGGKGEKTFCGPFKVDFAHLQGAARESRVPSDEHARLSRKLNRFGGLYIYRDGIRILPYGNSDYDWLNIETRRNRGQGYYFFAYRRIFGAVEITQRENAALVEKAGREGFQTNKAYRQFTAILENFFVQLAADFFRDTGAKSAVYSEKKKAIERAELARRKREESVAARRKAFVWDLENFFARVQTNEPSREIEVIFEDVQNALRLAEKEKDADRATTVLIEAEVYAEGLLSELRKHYTVAKPRDIGLGISVRRDWEAYVAETERLEQEVFAPTEVEIRRLIGVAAVATRVHVDQHKRLVTLIREVSARVDKTIRTRANDTRQVADEKHGQIKGLANRAIAAVKDVIDSVNAEMQRMALSGTPDARVEELRLQLAERLETSAAGYVQTLDSLRQQLLEIHVDVAGSSDAHITSGEMTGAIEEELLALRDAAEADAELVQLGMALAVVTHEFDAVIRTIRDQLKRLKGWANASPQLRPIYDRISTSFEHLDGYLALFTPLQRRLYRSPQNISGSEIHKFLEELFGERMRRVGVTFDVSQGFFSYTLIGYPSTFYPVFVNLIDNAIFWLEGSKPPRKIILDADSEGLLVANTGPRIAARDRDAIFDLRFTRKPGGRGMGLYISRQALARAGFALTLEVTPRYPVCFRLAPVKDRKLEESDGIGK